MKVQHFLDLFLYALTGLSTLFRSFRGGTCQKGGFLMVLKATLLDNVCIAPTKEQTQVGSLSVVGITYGTPIPHFFA